MKILPDVALTYDDVLLVPQNSDVDFAARAFDKDLLNEENYIPDTDRVR